MILADLFPPNGQVQRLYCDLCQGRLDLAFTYWEDEVSHVHIRVEGLPVLESDAFQRTEDALNNRQGAAADSCLLFKRGHSRIWAASLPRG